MTEIELLIDLHSGTNRQGPGSEEDTIKALELLNIAKSDSFNLLDIGCGTGGQTIILAQHTSAQITAVDLFPEFLKKLDTEAKNLGLQDRITTLTGSMDDLPFSDNEFDIIWSEGAIYIMGFENGIKYWNRFLKPGGYLAVSEISWITDSRPEELTEYWNKKYPEIVAISNKINILEKNGYSPVAHFVLPSSSWLDNYYKPIQGRYETFLERHNYSDQAKAIINMEKEEIRIYEKYQDYYSYGFYLAKIL